MGTPPDPTLGHHPLHPAPPTTPLPLPPTPSNRTGTQPAALPPGTDEGPPVACRGLTVPYTQRLQTPGVRLVSLMLVSLTVHQIWLCRQEDFRKHLKSASGRQRLTPAETEQKLSITPLMALHSVFLDLPSCLWFDVWLPLLIPLAAKLFPLLLLNAGCLAIRFFALGNLNITAD